MKYKKCAVWTLSAVLVAGTALAGCGRQEEEAEAVPVDVVAEIVPIEDEEETIMVIGDWQTATESVTMTNQMGGTITGLSVKNPEDPAYPANMMKTDQRLEVGEQADFYYEPETVLTEAEMTELLGGLTLEESEEESGEEAAEDALELEEEEVMTEAQAVQSAWLEAFGSTQNTETTGAGNGTIGDQSGMTEEELALAEDQAAEIDAELETDAALGLDAEETSPEDEMAALEAVDLSYFLQVTLEDGTIFELTFFDIADMDEVTLCRDGDVAYLQYTSLKDGSIVSTKPVELIIKANKEAAQLVDDLITALGVVTEENLVELTDQIVLAMNMYNSLTDAQKAYVTNLPYLQEVERMLAEAEDVTEEELEEEVIEEPEEVEEVVEEVIEEEQVEDTDDTGDNDWDDTDNDDTSDDGQDDEEEEEEWDEDIEDTSSYDPGNQGDEGEEPPIDE